MEFVKLEIENFNIHKKVEINFDFTTALIIGAKDNDEKNSNGTGKSTIFKAIVFALFGKHNKKSIDKIIKKNENKCTVCLEFIIDSVHYRVERSRNRKNKSSELLLFIKKDNEFVAIDGVRTSETDKYLSEILKINYSAFAHSNLFSQGDLFGLASAKDSKARFQVLEEVLILKEYSEIEAYIKKNYIPSLNKEITIAQTQVNTLSSSVDDLTSLESKLESNLSTLTKVQDKKSSLEISVLSFKKELEILEKTIVNNNDQEILNKIKSLEETKTSRITSLNKNKQILLDKKENQAKFIKSLEDLQLKKNNLEKEQSKLIAEPVENKEKIKENLEKQREKELQITKSIAVTQSKIKTLQQPLPQDKVCSQCKQEITDEYKSQHLTNCQQQIVLLKESLNEDESKLNKIKEKCTELKNTLVKIGEHSSKLLQIQNKLSIINNEIVSSDNGLKQSKKDVEFFESEIKTSQSKIEALISEQETYKKSISDSPDFNFSKIEQTRQNLLIEEEKLSNIINVLNNGNTSIAIVKNKILTAKENIVKYNQLKKELKDKEYNLSLYQEASLIFGQYIPKAITINVINDLNIFVSEKVSKIRPGFEVIFILEKDKNNEDTFDILYKVDGIEFDWDDLSGAEQFMITLCFKLSLSKIIQNNFGVDIKLFCFDEIDQGLDAISLNYFYIIVKELEKQAKVMIISHRDGLKDRFKSFITIVNKGKDEGSFAEQN